MSEQVVPFGDAMDAFDAFWNATVEGDEGWTVVGIDCECENCRFCGIRWALHWTHALLSNPSLIQTAERMRETRRTRRADSIPPTKPPSPAWSEPD